jgi:plastocyanin
MKRASWILGLVATVAVAFVLLAAEQKGLDASAQDRAASGAEVKIDNFSFAPGTVTVPLGTKVTWTNRDDIPHTVASPDRLFKSKVMDTDESYSFTFATPGEYAYFCSLHPHMTGTIVVEAGSASAQ